MIWNYGLHWHVDRVWWGSPSPGDAGLLYGATNRNAPEEQVVDFREQIGIYALYADYDLFMWAKQVPEAQDCSTVSMPIDRIISRSGGIDFPGLVLGV